MGLYRYTASADNTIANAFRSNLTGRGTGSNMGASDVLEAFYIEGQTSSSSGLSSEKSRILIKFDLDGLTADRSNGTIPASGSVSWYLRMYNAAHASTLPKGFKMVAKVVSGSWQEGTGLDMDEYTDQTYGVIPGSSWVTKGLDTEGYANWLNQGGDYADDSLSPPVASNTFTDGTEDLSIDVSDMVEDWVTGGTAATAIFGLDETSSIPTNYNGKQLTLVDSQGFELTFALTNTTTATVRNIIGISGISTEAGLITAIANAINGISELRITAATISSGAEVELTQDDIGVAGNQTSAAVGAPGRLTITGSNLTNGFDTPRRLFQGGTGIPNYGFGVMLSGSFETGSQTYYTKKFFSRSTEYFFKRPVLEARWDSSKKDNAGNFFLSSAVAPSDENVNTLYYYNYVRGQLKNLPTTDSLNRVYLYLYTGSADGTFSGLDSALSLKLPVGAGVVTEGNRKVVGGLTSTTGVYSASLSFNSASVDTVFPVWQWQPGSHQGGLQQFHTGSSITVKKFGSLNNMDANPEYVSKITNLKDSYSTSENARFRLYVREKNWNPTIYTVANSEIENYIIEDAYFKVFRIVDDLELIPYGTGSSTSPEQTGSVGSYTRLSYDISGNYFDLNMDMLENGYAYGVKLAYYTNGRYDEQPEVFKFRIED